MRKLVISLAALLGFGALAPASAEDAPRGRTSDIAPTAQVDACVQADRNNTCVIKQSSDNNVAGVVQAGDVNNSSVNQTGGGTNRANVNQIGRGR